jgi:hypothetical protein
MRSTLQIVGRWWKFLLAAGIVFTVIFGAPRLARHLIETRALTTGPNGWETPASIEACLSNELLFQAAFGGSTATWLQPTLRVRILQS